MTTLADIPLSMLDLVPVRTGGSVAEALHNSLDLARHVERLGFNRFWLAEHHNMDGIASSATALLIGHIAGGTSRIREVPPAIWPISSAVAELAMPSMLWCSASQKRLKPRRSTWRARSRELCRASATLPPVRTGTRSSMDRGISASVVMKAPIGSGRWPGRETRAEGPRPGFGSILYHAL